MPYVKKNFFFCCQSSYVISRQKLLKSKIQKHTIDGNTKFYYPRKSQLNWLKIEKLVWKRSLFDDSADPGCLWRLTVNPTETLFFRKYQGCETSLSLQSPKILRRIVGSALRISNLYSRLMSLLNWPLTENVLNWDIFLFFLYIFWINRGYYTVARRYESILFSSGKTILFLPRENKFVSSSRRVMFFLLYRQKDMDKIIDFCSPKSNCDGSNLQYSNVRRCLQ